ncbi:hypothetical protein EJ06DRAFT_403132 [Trichodelitschia bisporula]|uniref:Uncharacterized protein n=1 Tax=Trichodelitschia bisporula TaxID=703511 RepID=A0A6G1HXC6_9PEZI|nr:hypothetical protein EJ06DRAFT_403132 [Trichodelitschia bisporula]
MSFSAVRPRSSTANSSNRRTPTLGNTGSTFSAPRTPCPRDVDAFSYDPAHLDRWTIPVELWNSLPPSVQSPLVMLQQNGAAVFTSFDRLEKLAERIPLDAPGSPSTPAGDSDADWAVEESFETADSIHTKMFRSGMAGIRRASSSVSNMAGHVDMMLPPAAKPLPRALSVSTSTTSGSFPVKALLWSPEGQMTPPTPMSPDSPSIAPFMLSPPASNAGTPHYPDMSASLPSSWDDEKLPPKNPAVRAYRAELSYLRGDILVRLRHLARKVDMEWRECRKYGMIAGGDDIETKFEACWNARKEMIAEADALCQQLCAAIGLEKRADMYTGCN